ncbi:hypothetical protein COY62_03880 [bacterium (Candidatus Howlettbacteria) CG_4_10_14_0_8_um_filter_40_9]|nr:MAG: hypothetical protein COY62_03880 [bacterium (Candidatus Howlettbacteria) CG_4_10_14_0_8_um_filter_40_9]
MTNAKNIIKNKSFVIPLAVVVIFAIAAIVLTKTDVLQSLTTDKNVLAIVGNEKITKQDLNEQIYGQDFSGSIDDPKDISKEEKNKLLDQLIEWKIAKLKAAKDDISVSDKELDDYIKANLKSYDQYNDEQKKITQDTSYNSLLQKKVEDAVAGWKEGSYILVNFSKNFGSDPGFTKEEKVKEDIGREARVAEDTSYAKNLIDSIYAEVKSGKMTFEQGMEKAKNDSKLGEPGYAPSHILQSDSFTKDDYIKQQKIFGLDEAKDKIANLKIDQLSEPIVLKVAVSDEKGAEELRDGIWMIASVKESKTGESSSYEEWLEGQMKELSVRKINENLSFDLINGLSSKVYATKGGHNCGDNYQSHWGVNTGSSSSTAGLVVTTHYYTASGAYYELNGVTVNINDYSGSGGAYGGKGIFLTPNGIKTNGLSNANFTTGEAFYYNNFQKGPTCYRNSALVLGYGSTSGTGLNGHFGNGYTLGCKENYTVSVLSSGPGKYGGYWTGGESWNGAAKNIKITNGYTTWLDFKWHMNPNSAPTAIQHSPLSNTILAVGTTSVHLEGRGMDPNPEQIKLRIKYRSRNTSDTTWTTWWTSAWTGYSTKNTNRVIYTPALANGKTYEWRVQVADNGSPVMTSAWTGTATFSVASPTLSATLAATPISGTTTSLVSTLTATATSSGLTGTYNWIFYTKKSTDARYQQCARFDAVTNNPKATTCTFAGTYPATTYNVRVLVERGSLQAYSTPLNITVVKPHIISCNALTAAPAGGTLPLTVTFTAGVVDSWNHAITYLWDFSYDGTTFNSERQTSSNQTSFTFTTNGSQKVAVKGISDISTPVSGCPSTVEFNVNPWSSSDQNEVAP